MKLAECDLDISQIWMAPVNWTRPTEEWSVAHSSGAIPDSLFRLYTQAGFLSQSSAPVFLSDENHALFGYFGLLLRGMRDLGVEAQEERLNLKNALSQTYDPVKKLRGEKWDRKADIRARRHLKHLLIALSAILDTSAELVALFFFGKIAGLRLARAEFIAIERWLAADCEQTEAALISADEYFLEKLRGLLKPQVITAGVDSEWLPLLRLLRNKLAHTGHRLFFPSFRCGDEFLTFIPRVWPYIKEAEFERGPTPEIPDWPSHCRQVLIQEDLLSFADGLYYRVNTILSSICDVLNQAYEQLGDFPVNEEALHVLKDQKTFKFEFFPP
ncbi:MAG TPA: hypothetical protein VIW64_00715 [Pyrinomonadaceae bacterium]|jgi:hypothetical protein